MLYPLSYEGGGGDEPGDEPGRAAVSQGATVAAGVVGAGPDPSLGGSGVWGRGGAAAGERSGVPGPPGALRRPVAADAVDVLRGDG